jgi:hypothetical protein
MGTTAHEVLRCRKARNYPIGWAFRLPQRRCLAGHVKDAAQGLAPCLEAAQAAAAGGLPELAQAWQRVRQAATSRARLAPTQFISPEGQKPSRRQGWSLRASSRVRTKRRAIAMRVQAQKRILLTAAPNSSLR